MKKIRVSNKDARFAVNGQREFKGSHTFAEIDESGAYKVYSYGYHFPIYAFVNGKWYANKDKYSVSTSKHQSQLRPEGNLILVSTQEIKDLKNKKVKHLDQDAKPEKPAEPVKVKCDGCDEEVSEDDLQYCEWSGKRICNGCAEVDRERPSVLVKYEDGAKEVVKFGEYDAWTEDGDSAPDWFKDVYEARTYVRSDAWRGHYETKFKGLETIVDGWVTGYPDDSQKPEKKAIEFHEYLNKGGKIPVTLYWLFEPTSNVFSTASEILCRTEDKEVLIAWLNSNGFTVEDLQSAFN